ncbi:hypothetical protein STEG23_025159, partial [Scotinomys teguina]
MEPEPQPEPQPEPVTLLVKSPNQRHRDLELSGDRSWSVSHLKAHLSRVYPERPRPEDQRLIYSGKMLLDHQYLRDLLPKQEKRHVLHLVCNVKNPSKMPGASTKGAESTEQPANTNQAQHPGDSSSDGLRQREVLRNLSPSGWENISRPEAVQQAFQGLGPGFSGYTTYGWLQLSWFQQIYARQYYMQYLAATAASGAFVPTPSAQEIPVVSTPAPAPIHNQFPAENQPANQNAAAQVVVNPGANQNLRMNAQGGPLVEEDDEINRDWLDWTYSAATFSVFLSILYFYSSLSRFLMVMGATVVMYLCLLLVLKGPSWKAAGLASGERRKSPGVRSPRLPQETIMSRPLSLLKVNQEIAKVIQTAFQRASYPDIKGERSMMLFGRVKYGLHTLSIEQSVDFEIESAIDLQINTQLTCDSGNVRTDALDCSISFHKLLLYLQGEHEPGWIKWLFTNIISLTLKLFLKGQCSHRTQLDRGIPCLLSGLLACLIHSSSCLLQVCKEIKVISNIMADFVQTRADALLSKASLFSLRLASELSRAKEKAIQYTSFFQGHFIYKNISEVLPLPPFSPTLLGDTRMLYFWLSEQVLDSLAEVTFQDGRLQFSLEEAEIRAVLETWHFNPNQKVTPEMDLLDITTSPLLSGDDVCKPVSQ